MRSLIHSTILGASALLCAAMSTAAPIDGVPAANPKSPGTVMPNVLARQLDQRLVATGAIALENPTSGVGYYGYDNNGPMIPVLSTGLLSEASKTEPDKNTYLRIEDQSGPDVGYHYGEVFLFQGHEAGLQGYITRVNLDADVAHRVTLMTDHDVAGAPLPVFDGSTWDPFARLLLFTAENGPKGGVWQATIGYPSQAVDISGVVGRGGYEGIQIDDSGNLWIVEDVGSAVGTGANRRARRPNSFIYRFVPIDPSNLLRGGKLQALQVNNKAGTAPIIFDATLTVDQAAFLQDVADLHTYGIAFGTRWVTIHDTAVDGSVPFDANALAKSKQATPFKRPENGVFQPGSNFGRFFFTETGDTNQDSTANSGYGGYGGVFYLSQQNGASDTGTLRLFYRGNLAHTGFDNIQFFTANQLMVVEDAGDGLHTQRNALDSGYLFNLQTDYSSSSNQPVRFLAEGRDPSATLDSGLSGVTGFQNDGDNEITGVHVSDGDPTVRGLLGGKLPSPFRSGWRVFFTQQHGDNNTWEILPNLR
jgi:Bacterial protein of unknown function (DUF839)